MKNLALPWQIKELELRLPRATNRNAPFDHRKIVIGLAVFAAYYLGAKIGFALTFYPHPVSVLWPPNSILVAALLLTPPRMWWIILLSAFPGHWVAQLQSHVPPTMILCWFVSNSCEAVIGAGLTRYLIGGPIYFSSLRNAGIFCLGVAFAGPFLSSFLDAAFVGWNHWGQDPYWQVWRVRFTSNVLAALTIAPLIVTWATSGIAALRKADRARYFEAGLLFLGLLSVSFAVLYRLGSDGGTALLYLPLPFLLWAAVRFGSCGASTAVCTVAFSAIWSAARGHGPFSGGSAEDNALSIQMFLIVMSLPLMFLAAVVEERGKVEERFAKAFRSSPAAMWIIRRRDGCIIDINERWQKIFGYGREEAIGGTASDLHIYITEDDREKLILGTSEGEPLRDFELSLRTKAGDVRQTLLLAETADMAGEPCLVMIFRDITARKKAEAALRESEARFRIVADAAPVLIWMAGLDKLCNFFNKSWLEFTGRTIEQEMGNGWSEGVHPDDLPRCFETYVTAFDSRQPFVTQYRLKRHDGQYRVISDNGVPRYDERGNFAGYIGSCMDVTELMRKEKALREFEERVGLAAEAAQLGVWELDATTNEVWMSDKARALFQFEAETRLNHAALQDRVHPEDRALRDSAVQRAIGTRGEYEIEYRVLLPDGTVRWIGGRARLLSDSQGKLTRLLGVSMDVTARKQAQELFRLATEASPSGIVLVNNQGRIMLVNAHVEELFGYGREELVGKSVDVLVPKGFVDGANFLAGPATQEMSVPRELVARRKDNHEFPVEIGLNSIQTPDGVLVLATVVDISARKRAAAEARLRREELDHLSRVALMGEMSASLAHELNQPLTGIVSNASAGERFIDRGDVNLVELRELLADIGADGRRAGEVVRGIRSMVKKGGTARRRVNLNDVVMNAVRMINHDAMLHSCVLKTSLEPNLPTIEADPIQLQQVLLNLLLNAFDAMRDTPVSRRKVLIVTERNGQGAICTSVCDQGTGISDEARPRLFEQFFTTKAEGLGMGLAIVRSIVESHAGTIAAENVEDGGARFEFTIPAAHGASP